MILTYKSINNLNAVTMTVVSENKTWFLKGYSDDEHDLAIDLMVDDEVIDTILVAAGRDRDALFADIPDEEALEDALEDQEDDDKHDAYFAALEKRYAREQLIFGTILREVVRELKEDEPLVDLEIIIPVCVASVRRKLTAKKTTSEMYDMS